MTKQDLKPCPFCGGEAHVYNVFYDGDNWQVACIKCGAFGAHDKKDECGLRTKKEAVDHWNHRLTEDKYIKRLERISGGSSWNNCIARCRCHNYALDCHKDCYLFSGLDDDK